MDKTESMKRNINPMIYEKTRDGEALYDIYSRLLKDRIVYLAEAIDADVASTISATLLWLNSQNNSKEISLYINSPGGEVHAGLFTIYDTMNYIEAPIKTVCVGEAYSAAALILSAGNKGSRRAFPNSYIMIHEMQIGGLSGPGSEIQREAERIRVWNEKIAVLLARHCEQPIEVIKESFAHDRYFTAEEAKEFGLIDKIVEPKKDIPELIKQPSTKARRRKAIK